MDLEEQKTISEHFERMHRTGTKPWRHHNPEPMLTQFFQTLKEERPDAVILDVGCGDGWISLHAARLGFRVAGIDSSVTAIAHAKEGAGDAGLDVDFRVGDVLDLPYEAALFDAIIDRGLFHHILPENRPLYLDNVARVLENGGSLYLACFSMDNPEGIGQRFTPQDIAHIFANHFVLVASSQDMSHTPANLLHFVLRRQEG